MAIIYQVTFTGQSNGTYMHDIVPAVGTNKMVKSRQVINTLDSRGYSIGYDNARTTTNESLGADYAVRVAFRHLYGERPNCSLRLLLRVDSTTDVNAPNACCGLRIRDGDMQLFHTIANVTTLLGSAHEFAFADNGDYTASIIAVGASLYATLNGSLVLGPITTTVTAANEAGVWYTDSGSTVNGNRIDTFVVDTDVSLPSSASTIVPRLNGGLLTASRLTGLLG